MSIYFVNILKESSLENSQIYEAQIFITDSVRFYVPCKCNIIYFVLPLFLVQYTFFPMKLISWLIDISEQYFVTTASWVLNVYTESLFSPQIVIRRQTTWSHIAYILKLCLISKLYIFYFLWPIVFACFSHTYFEVYH